MSDLHMPWRTPEKQWQVDNWARFATGRRPRPFFRRFDGQNRVVLAKLVDASTLDLRASEPKHSALRRVVDGLWVSTDASYYVLKLPDAGFRVIGATRPAESPHDPD